MTFCKISVFAFYLFFICSTAFAAIEVDDMVLMDESAYGSDKTLSFSCWGKMPFEEMVKITQDLGQQKVSLELAKMTAEVLSQKTSLNCNDLTQTNAKKWLLIRLKTLLNLGFSKDVLSFISSLPPSVINDDILYLEAEAFLVSDELGKACLIASKNAGKTDEFTKMNIMCLALNGQKDKALLAYDLYKESHEKADAFSYAMNTFFDLPKKDFSDAALSIAETYLFKKLNLLNEKMELPLAYQPFVSKNAGTFGNAVNIKKLLERWQKANVSESEQQYRLYLLATYKNLFREDLRLLSTSVLWQQKLNEQKYAPISIMLNDKPESEIFGAELLLSLWLLSQQSMSVDNALLLLNKEGLDIERFIVERLD